MAKDMIAHPIQEAGYIPAFMWTRLAVICLIAIGHISTLPIGPNANEVLHIFGYDPSWLGVNTLFMLAGFMAMRSLMHHDSPVQLLLTRGARNVPMVIIYVLITLLILVPIYGTKNSNISSLHLYLLSYAFEVISFVNPGRELLGLVDESKYASCIQGAIWTFRWGLIAYIGAAIGWKTGLFKSRLFMGYSAILALLTCIALHGVSVWRDIELPAIIATALRLGWPFLLGMAAYQNMGHITRRKAIAIALLVMTTTLYAYTPWTPLIEVCATLFWGYVSFLCITTTIELPKLMKTTPDLALGIYVFHWPTAQIILLMRPDITPLELFLYTAPITIALSYGVCRGLNKRPGSLDLTPSKPQSKAEI